MNLTFGACRVGTGYDEEGMLAFDGDRRFLAVLVRLSDEDEIAPGCWFLEAGFGRVATPNGRTFASLEEAESWILSRLH